MQTIILLDVVTGALHVHEVFSANAEPAAVNEHQAVEFGPEISISQGTSDLRFLPITQAVARRPGLDSGDYRFSRMNQMSWERQTRRDALTALVMTTMLANFVAAMFLHWL